MNLKAAIGWSEGWPGGSLPICYGPAMSEVETARLLLRRWQEDDLERLVALYSDQRVARFLGVDGRPWPSERSVGAFEHFRRQWQEHDVGPWAAIDKHTDRWLGQIGLNELSRWPGPDKIEVGWDLHPSVWGQGLATEGARAALGYGFEVVGLEKIISTAGYVPSGDPESDAPRGGYPHNHPDRLKAPRGDGRPARHV
jgi:RimJ/RimL family protein N-acetyltransferase